MGGTKTLNLFKKWFISFVSGAASSFSTTAPCVPPVDKITVWKWGYLALDCRWSMEMFPSTLGDTAHVHLKERVALWPGALWGSGTLGLVFLISNLAWMASREYPNKFPADTGYSRKVTWSIRNIRGMSARCLCATTVEAIFLPREEEDVVCSDSDLFWGGELVDCL